MNALKGLKALLQTRIRDQDSLVVIKYDIDVFKMWQNFV
jgi:hypothetical protein